MDVSFISLGVNVQECVAELFYSVLKDSFCFVDMDSGLQRIRLVAGRQFISRTATE